MAVIFCDNYYFEYLKIDNILNEFLIKKKKINDENEYGTGRKDKEEEKEMEKKVKKTKTWKINNKKEVDKEYLQSCRNLSTQFFMECQNLECQDSIL